MIMSDVVFIMYFGYESNAFSGSITGKPQEPALDLHTQVNKEDRQQIKKG